MQFVWGYYLFSLLPILQFVSCLVLPSSPHRPEIARDLFQTPKLFKRTQINLNGFPIVGTNGPSPITNNDIDSYIDQVADLAQYVVDNVQPNHATFLRFFGGNTYYNEAMTIFRRLANIRNEPGPAINFNMINNAGPQGLTGDNGLPGTVIGEYGQIDGQATLNLYQHFTTLRDIMTIIPGQTAAGQLERFAVTRQGTIAHELFHWAGDNTIFGNLVDTNQYQDFPTPDLQRIVDVFIEQPAVGDADYTFLVRNGIHRTRQVAYGEHNVLLLAQLQNGEAFAIRNADTYTQFMYAVYTNYNTRRFTPTHGNLYDKWDGADFGDPFGGTRPPFGGIAGGRTLPGNSAARAGVIWGALGRLSGELKT